ncbi:MAG TPA: phage holin family protein, partial [Thermomicrobiales bacterium]|nr:phage holin family protein [Thermomicrobiales bacterium]
MIASRSLTTTLKDVGIETSIVVRHLIVWMVEALVLIGLAKWIPGIRITGFGDALVVILALATINAFVMPGLFRIAVHMRAFLFPIATFFLDGSTLVALDSLLPNWDVDGWLVSGVIAGILTIVASVLGSILALSDEQAWQRYSLGPMRSRYLRGQATIPQAHGFIFLEIDGLAEPVLRDAIARGYVPNMASWLRSGSHCLARWECDLSSQTSASQAGILLGNNANVPAFRWYDKELRRVIVSNHFRDSALLQERLSSGDGLLRDNGASRGNLFSGDAPDSLFTFSTLGDRGQGGNNKYWFFYANLFNIARTLALFVADIFRELAANLWQQLRNERPRVHRGGVYPFARAATTSLLREFSTFTVAGDMMRGVASVYTTYLAYDEVAHHSGIARGDTLRVLKAVDRDIGRLARVAADTTRPYHLVVLSDHGQSQGATFRQEYGVTLRELVEQTIAGYPGHHAGEAVIGNGNGGTDEGWQGLSALLTDVLVRDRQAHPMMQRAFRRKITDGEVHLGYQEREFAADAGVVVLASGSLGLISFPGWAERVTLEEIEVEFPALIPALVEHPGIGFIVVATKENGPVVLGSKGVYILDEDRAV